MREYHIHVVFDQSLGHSRYARYKIIMNTVSDPRGPGFKIKIQSYSLIIKVHPRGMLIATGALYVNSLIAVCVHNNIYRCHRQVDIIPLL